MADTRKFHPNGDSYCCECKKIRHDSWRKTSIGKEKFSEYSRKSKIKKAYGLNIEEYNEILSKQNNGCCICGITTNESGRSLHIDHDHLTGKVRGILCHGCNTALGLVGDDISILHKMIEYLTLAKAGKTKKKKFNPNKPKVY